MINKENALQTKSCAAPPAICDRHLISLVAGNNFDSCTEYNSALLAVVIGMLGLIFQIVMGVCGQWPFSSWEQIKADGH